MINNGFTFSDLTLNNSLQQARTDEAKTDSTGVIITKEELSCNLQQNNVLSSSQVIFQQKSNLISIPSHLRIKIINLIKRTLVFSLAALCIWILLFILFDSEALPGGSLFALGLLEITAIILGKVCEYFNVPPMLGMLAAGFINRNVFKSYFDESVVLKSSLSNPLRAISVVILLTRGAFGVIPADLKKFSRTVPQLSVLACIFEAIVGATAVYLLLEFPIIWSLLMGCIFSAMSGTCTLPYLFQLEKSYFQRSCRAVKIAITGCGLDAILAICLAELCFGVIFGDGTLKSSFMHGPFELLVGAGVGIGWGSIIGLFLGKENSNNEVRTLAVVTGGIISLLGLTKFGMPRGGPLGTYINALIPSILWRSRKVDGENNTELNESMNKIWYFFQPLLFGIIGFRINFALVDWHLISMAFLCLIISLFGRLISVFGLVSYGGNLELNEKYFLVFSWIPKGTVQAALGPVVLETAYNLFKRKDSANDHIFDYGQKIMEISVLVIVMGASFGALAMLFIAPKFLKRL